MNLYYIAYSMIEEQSSANQIQTKNTFLGLRHIFPDITGIFLGNKRSLLWKVRKQNNSYFIDKSHFKTGIIEKYFNIGILRKNFFPYLFARRSGQLQKLTTRHVHRSAPMVTPQKHRMTTEFYHLDFERAYSHKKHAEFFNLLKYNSKRARIVTLTQGLANIIRTEFNYQEQIEVIPDAHNFPVRQPKIINFKKGKIEIVYTGLNFKNRGVEMLIEALDFLPDVFYVRLVGGQAQQREDFKKKYHSLIVLGRLIMSLPVAHLDVKEIMVSADIAVLPTPLPGFASFTSPLKLFEYMAAGMPIIASDTESFREILSEKSALFFKEYDSRDLAAKIKYLSGQESIAQTMGRTAFLQSHNYTYAKLAEKISRLFLPI